MTNKALKKRHWDRISEITDYPIDIDSEDLRLKRIMDAPLMKFKEEIEV
jgi:dynein heavy chain